MSYRIEHNYLLNENDELVAFATWEESSPLLFILTADPVQVIKSDDAEAEEDCENLVRATEAGDITRSEWDDFLDNSNGGTNLLEIDRTYTKSCEHKHYAVIRFIRYYTDHDSPEFFNCLGDLYPPIRECGRKYFEALESEVERSLILSWDWIGMLDSGTNDLYAYIDDQGFLNLEIAQTFGWGEPDEMYGDYFCYSNLHDEMVLAAAEKIKDREQFIRTFAAMLQDAEELDNMGELEELEMDYDEMASKLNKLNPPFRVEASDIAAAHKLALDKENRKNED